MKASVWVHAGIASLSGLAFYAGFAIFLQGFDLWGSSPSPILLVIAVALSLAGAFLISFVNCRFLPRAALAVALVVVPGLPIAALVLPVFEQIGQALMPEVNVSLSGSFTAIPFLLASIAVIELVTGRLLQNRRWIGGLIGLFFVLMILMLMERLTAHLGQSSWLSFSRLWVYAPLTWGGIHLAVNLFAKPVMKPVPEK